MKFYSFMIGTYNPRMSPMGDFDQVRISDTLRTGPKAAQATHLADPPVDGADAAAVELPRKNDDGTFKAGPFMPDKNGYVRDFLAIGYFPNLENKQGQRYGMNTDWLGLHWGQANIRPDKGMDHNVILPENPKGQKLWKPGKYTVTWQPVKSSTPMVNMIKNRFSPDQPIFKLRDLAAYVCCYVKSPEKQTLSMQIASSQEQMVWVNTVKKSAQPVADDATKGQLKCYKVTLDKGWNIVMLKLSHTTGPWEFSLRFLDNSLKPVNGLKISY